MSAQLSAKYTLLAPAIYLAVVVTGLLVFSRIWRKPQKGVNSGDAPWFGRHVERDLYYSLLAQKNPPADDLILKSALLRRAMEDVKRIWRMREVKPTLNQLVARGLVAEELWSQFLVTEKELEAEIFEVVNEAQTFKEGWGPAIFATASEMAQHEKQKDIIREISTIREKTNLKLQRKKAMGLPVPNTIICNPEPQSSSSAAVATVTPAQSAAKTVPNPAPVTPLIPVQVDDLSKPSESKSLPNSGAAIQEVSSEVSSAVPTSIKSKKSKKNKK